MSDQDFATEQQRELAKTQMVFALGTENLISKASIKYLPWKTGDPTTIGVYGLHDRNMTSKIFDNQLVQTEDEGLTWTYTPVQYWADFTSYRTFDFFGYMPKVANDTSEPESPRNGAKLEKDPEAEEYTLSFPVTLPNSVINDVSNVPLICATPVHKTKVGEVISYYMDKTMTGFSLKFKLGDKMSNIRDFVIKQVKIKGAIGALPTYGVVSRTYTYVPSTDSWTAGDITWSDIATNAAAIDYEVPFVDHDNEGTIYVPGGVAGTGTLRIGYSNPGAESQWGANFYAIPSASFTPTIEVKYDVTVQDEEGNYIETRTNITNTIQFSNGYFEAYTSGGSVDQLHTILVQIVPDYLYVLADADQRASWLLLE
ncbi:MAG: hypothetical protein J6W24_01585 [Prevotella sp.]|nr:hypothetical protein [Prevotella sp.]